MSEEPILFAPPYLDDAEVAEVTAALRSGWITTGPRTHRFAAEFGAYLGAPAALPVSSCTAALHLALLVEGVGPGDEVVTTPMTFCSTVHVIQQTGARAVLADVDPVTLNLDPERAAAAVTPRTRAILPVHYGGHPVDLPAFRDLARRHGAALIEDAAHALPAAHGDETVGAADNLVAFSFYATKNLATGEGGMLTGAEEKIDRARVLSLHGMDRDAWKRYDRGGNWYYEIVAPGLKYNLSDLHAALGLVQLAKLDAMQRRRRAVVAAYAAGLAPLGAFELPGEAPGVTSAWHLYPVRLRPGAWAIDRARFIEELTARGVGSSVHFIPVTHHPHFQRTLDVVPADCPVSTDAYGRLVSLPLHPGLDDAQVARVIAAVAEIHRLHGS